jgi:hypothetical protein
MSTYDLVYFSVDPEPIKSELYRKITTVNLNLSEDDVEQKVENAIDELLFEGYNDNNSFLIITSDKSCYDLVTAIASKYNKRVILLKKE